jgi:hypothetical protein
MHLEASKPPRRCHRRAEPLKKGIFDRAATQQGAAAFLTGRFQLLMECCNAIET